MLSRELLRQIITFGVVGVTATLVHYFVALFFTEFFSVSVFASNILGYLSAVSVSLFGHSFYSFRKQITQRVVRRFVLVSISTLMGSEGVLYILHDVFTVHHRIALAVVVCTIPVITFFLNKFWVYSASHRI
ncbi:MAG: GtrA family protein [Agarilytica sp.]